MANKAAVPKSRDLTVALIAADEFLRVSRLFTDSLPKDLIQAANVAVRNTGGLIVSATTLVLATELYLKSLLFLLGTDVAETHNLWDIFKRLPTEVKQGIENEFKARFVSSANQPDGANQPHGLKVAIWVRGQSEKPALSDTPQEWKRDLKSILRDSRNAFVSWRYLYEMGQEGKHVFFNYEYGSLGLLCEIVRRMVQDGLQNGKIVVTT